MFGLDLEVKRLILQNQRSVLFFSWFLTSEPLRLERCHWCHRSKENRGEVKSIIL
jgi:hypothetical protein